MILFSFADDTRITLLDYRCASISVGWKRPVKTVQGSLVVDEAHEKFAAMVSP